MTSEPQRIDDDRSWDAFLLERNGFFLQSWGWSQFQEACGRTAYRFRVGDATGDKTVAQFLMIRHRLPLGAAYAYVPRGPVIAGETAAEKKASLLVAVQALRAAVPKLGCIFARIEPPFLSTDDALTVDELRHDGFLKVRSVQPADTSIVDLNRTPEELLAALHSKTRYNIRVAERHNVEIRDAQYDNAHFFRHDTDLFWNLLDETATRDDFHTHDKNYYEKMLDVLSPRKNGTLKVRLVFALYQGEPVAAALIAEFGKTMTYLHGASAAKFRSVMAPQLLHWKLINEARERGFVHYDFWGIAPEDASTDHPWSGITRFKEGFGGRRESYLGAWELTTSPIWYNLYRLAKRFKNV